MKFKKGIGNILMTYCGSTCTVGNYLIGPFFRCGYWVKCDLMNAELKLRYTSLEAFYQKPFLVGYDV